MAKPTRIHRIKVLLYAAGLAFIAIMGAIDIHLAVERFTPSQEEIFARMGLR